MSTRLRSFRQTVMSILLVAILWVDAAVAHQFEDGYVERSVAVRIRDRDVRIKYSIGLNDATMKKFMDRWPNDQVLYQKFQNEQIEQIGKPGQGGKKLNSLDSPLEKPLNLPEEGSLVNEIELIRAFAKVAAPQLREGLRVLSNKQPIELKLVSATPSSKHHATLETVWTFQLPPDAMVELSIQDTNFLKQPGGIKYSLKTSGSSMTLRSNVAPIQIRSTRIGLDSVDIRQRLLASGIQAAIRVLVDSDVTE